MDINIITEKHYKGKNIEKIIALYTADQVLIPITCKGLLQNKEKIIPFFLCVFFLMDKRHTLQKRKSSSPVNVERAQHHQSSEKCKLSPLRNCQDLVRVERPVLVRCKLE